MRPYSLLRTALFSVPALLAAVAHAHDGHGLLGTHWHATDALGFVAVAALIAAAIWLGRK
jgi:hypothetical protein